LLGNGIKHRRANVKMLTNQLMWRTKDLDPIDLLRALIGVANVATSPDWQQSAKRLVDILVTGSRPIK